MTLFLTVVVLVGAVFLGRETGLYDFHWISSQARSTLNMSWNAVKHRRGMMSISNVQEMPRGAERLFSDGWRGTLTLQSINHSGACFHPFCKHIDVTARASFASADSRLTAACDLSGSIDIKGIFSVLFIRNRTRAYCINVMLADLGNRL
jgi:hypothetical protein